MKNRFEVCGDIVKIYLNKNNHHGKYTIIDLVDLPRVAERSGTWCLGYRGKSNVPYAFINTTMDERRNGSPQALHLHRLIANTPDDLVPDHLNHDTLDNRRENLNNVTQAVNNKNRKNPFQTFRNTKGYFWCNTKNRWKVSVRMRSQERRQITVFKTEAEARVEATRRLEARKLLSLEQDGRSRTEGN